VFSESGSDLKGFIPVYGNLGLLGSGGPCYYVLADPCGNSSGPANNWGPANEKGLMCNSTTDICVPASAIPPPGYSPVKNAVIWYLCGNGEIDNIKNYTIEGTGKGAIVGGVFGSEFGPAGTVLGAAGGGIEGFFGGSALGIAFAGACHAAGVYKPAY
jgi:hypothetical protein